MVLMLSPVFVQQQEAVNRFVLSHLRGWRDCYFGLVKGQGDREAIAQIISQHTPIKDTQIILRMGSPGIEPNGELNLETLGAMQDHFLKVVSQKHAIDMKTLVDTSYLQRAVTRLGRVTS